MTYQTDKKHLTIFPEYFVGVVKLAINHYSNRFLLRVFTNCHRPWYGGKDIPIMARLAKGQMLE